MAASAGAAAAAHDRSGLNFVVAVDGSSAARRAFDTAAALVVPRRGDRLTVVHIGDPAKDYLPYEARPSAIETAFSTLCVSRFPSSAYRIVLHDKRAGQSTREAMMEVVTAVSGRLLQRRLWPHRPACACRWRWWQWRHAIAVSSGTALRCDVHARRRLQLAP